MPRLLPDYGLAAAVASGLLLAMAFPSPGISSLAWVGLVPLLLTMQRHPFRNGFLAGVAFFSFVLYWLNIVMTTYGGLSPILSIAAYLLLVSYLALYFAVAAWAACRLKQRRGYPFALTLPVLWVALEYVREFLLTGFPWASLGYSQQSLPMIQSAELFGVYGLSYLLLLSNSVITDSIEAYRAGGRQRLPYGSIAALGLLFALNLSFGWWRLDQGIDQRDHHLEVAVIQGNIDQAVKWNSAFQGKTVAIYRDLSLEARQAGATDLVVWPEAATPFYFQDGGRLAAMVSEVPQLIGAHLLFGSPAYREDPQQGLKYLNSAFLLSPQGVISGRSDKVHLVPFGEYVPMQSLLPFVDKLVTGIGDFSPGQVKPLALNGYSLGVLVCYEAIFPGLARNYVQRGSDLLVNITNDAWFGRSSAPAQHLAMVRFRAIENRVWVVRAANTGISAFIAPDGRILAATDLFETTFARAQVGLGAEPGLYAKTGDFIPGVFLVITLYWLVFCRRRNGGASA